MRMIDADKLMQDIRNTITEQSNTIDWLNLINRQPIAYDVDAVVEQLEEEKEKVGFVKATTEASAYICGINDAIKIVKGGGVNA